MSSKVKKVPALQIAKWAVPTVDGNLQIDGGVKPIKMGDTDGTGIPLVKNNSFGADVIRVPAGKGLPNHTHIGDHILFVIKGSGYVEYNGTLHPIYPGLSYLIPGEVDHAIKAKEDLVLIVVGNNHKALDSKERMLPVYSDSEAER